MHKNWTSLKHNLEPTWTEPSVHGDFLTVGRVAIRGGICLILVYHIRNVLNTHVVSCNSQRSVQPEWPEHCITAYKQSEALELKIWTLLGCTREFYLSVVLEFVNLSLWLLNTPIFERRARAQELHCEHDEHYSSKDALDHYSFKDALHDKKSACGWFDLPAVVWWQLQ